MPPRPTNGPDSPHSTDTRLALVEERQEQDRTDIRELTSTVSQLCQDVGPVVTWVRAQMEAATDEAKWRKSLIRDVAKYILSVVLVGLGALILAHPGELWGAIAKAVGGS